MMYAYIFTLARRAVVVTMDLSAANLHLLEQHHWLSSEDNVIALRLQEDVETVTLGSRTEEYINRSFFVNISLGNIPLPESTLLQQNRGRSRSQLFGYKERGYGEQ